MQEPLNGSNLRTIFLLLTRAHYSDTKNYGYLEPQLQCVLYSDNANEQSLYVELSQEYDYTKGIRRPAVYVGFDQPFQFKKIDLSHSQDKTYDNSGQDKGFLVTATLSLIHVAASQDTALLMADCSTAFFIGIRDALKSKLNLMSFDPISISPPAMVDKKPEQYFRVDCMFNLTFNYVVRVNLESHRLKKFALEFTGE